MKTKDELIHTALSQINWDFVLTAFKTLQLPWYEKKIVTKNDLINDLASLIQNAFDNEGTEIVTEYWVVIFIDFENDPYLEIIFTPMAVTINANQENKNSKRIEELKSRIKLHQELEEYELCHCYKQQLDKLEKKKKSKLKN